MKRPWHIWLIFTASLFALLGGLTWITVVAMQLDEAEQQAQARGQWEEDVRLALWRMDSYLMTTMISVETSRPYFVYSAAYPPYRAYAHMFSAEARGKGENETFLMPSPLLLATPPHVRIHFQAAKDGNLTSPESPSPDVCAMLDAQIATPERWDAAAELLADLRTDLSWDQLNALAPTTLSERAGPMMASAGGAQQQSDFAPQLANGPSQQGRAPPTFQSGDRSRNSRAAQQAMSQQEFSNRFNDSQTLQAQTANNNIELPLPDDVRSTIMSPAWFGDRLLLLRRVEANGEEYIQGAWLDWETLRRDLLGLVTDVFPDAELLSVSQVPAAGDEGSERMLAVIPARLNPGPMTLPPLHPWTPIRVALVAAWLCMLLAAAAVAALLMGVLRLSERRATFVSAVTHELRTPLTTFRMYSEMLASGMVPTEERRATYLETLRLEADRLGHLVENVLSFARLERTRTKDRARSLAVDDLIERSRSRLQDRAARSEMELEFEIPSDLEGKSVLAEPGACEQILINLVDNACKYASSARPALVRIIARASGSACEIRVCDHGPGITRNEARALFRPFTKSAAQAAHSAPGVGLGLALSRRLAREMGGDLTLDHSYSAGACFVLTLPWA